jgi:hypothetical protein
VYAFLNTWYKYITQPKTAIQYKPPASYHIGSQHSSAGVHSIPSRY